MARGGRTRPLPPRPAACRTAHRRRTAGARRSPGAPKPGGATGASATATNQGPGGAAGTTPPHDTGPGALADGEVADTSAARPSPIDQPDDDGSPYIGLRPYQLCDADLFHGRSAEIEHILQRMATQRSRPLVVVGASGSGKSSLLAAGVAPRWAAEGAPCPSCVRTT